jgi:hypothetical protein
MDLQLPDEVMDEPDVIFVTPATLFRNRTSTPT